MAEPKDAPELISTPKDSGLVLRNVIKGDIKPKSVVHSGQGLFFAQNMMYRHSITVYNRKGELIKTISDRIKLADFGHNEYKGPYTGAPVEATFTEKGRYAWISNYEMAGEGFDNPGADKCPIGPNYDHSYVYQIDTKTLEIIAAIKVGSVPKYLASTPDSRYVLASNWCSGDLSIIDTDQQTEIKRISLGRYPRGIVVDQSGQFAYISIMGSNKIAVVDLFSFRLSWLKDIGNRPRHLCLDAKNQYLYASLNSEGKVVKIKLPLGKVVKKSTTGRAPRSMVITEDGQYLYVVNYLDDNMSKIRCSDMKVVQTVNTGVKPIGITYDASTRKIWVACYPGSIMVFEDTSLPVPISKSDPILFSAGPYAPTWAETFIEFQQNTFAYVPPDLAKEDELIDFDAGPFAPNWADSLLFAQKTHFDYVDASDVYPPPELAADTLKLMASRETNEISFAEKSSVPTKEGNIVFVEDLEASNSVVSIEDAVLPNTATPPNFSIGPHPLIWDTVVFQFARLDTLAYTSKPPEVFIAAEELLMDPLEEEFLENGFNAPAHAPKPSDQFQLIVGSFSQQTNAAQAVEEFGMRGFAPIIISTDQSTYRVSIMSFNDYTEATKEKKRLLNETRINSWVLK